jgi:voltage-gated potassium channel
MILGISGFILIEGMHWIDALYMTIITVSTVGFGEVQDLSHSGKIFTIFLIVSSLTTYAYALSILSSFVFEHQLNYFIRGYRKKSLKKMQNHVIVCGLGRNGKQAIRDLQSYGKSFIAIDKDASALKDFPRAKDFFIEGDATEDEVLKNAKIETASALITTLPVDSENLYVVLTARALNHNLLIISRASGSNSEKKLRMAGVDNVVRPEVVGGAHMANLVAHPDIIEFMEHISVHGDDPTILEEIECDFLPGESKEKTIFEIGIRKKTGANIIGLKNPNGEFVLNPSPDTLLQPKTKLFVLGTPEQINMMKEMMHLSKIIKK